MDNSLEVDRLIEQLSAGFDALQHEYQKLFGSHSILERKLATAREQVCTYMELAAASSFFPTSTYLTYLPYHDDHHSSRSVVVMTRR